jgi:O-antigen ligase
MYNGSREYMTLTCNDKDMPASRDGFLHAARMMLYVLLVFAPLARGSVQDWAVTLIHIITVVALTLWGLHVIRNRRWIWIATPMDMPFILLLALTALSSVFAVYRPDSLWALALLVNDVAVFYLVIYTANDRRHLMQLIYVIIGIAVFLSVFGLIKKFGVNPFPWWEYDIGHGNLASTYGNRNHFAGYLEMAIPLLTGMLLADLKPAIRSFLLYLLALLLTTQILTLSRGGWAGTATALLFMAVMLMTNRYFRRKKRLAIFIGTLLFVSVVVFFNTSVVERIRTLTETAQDVSMDGRIIAWRGCLNMIAQHPLLGVGPGNFSLAFTRFQPPGFNLRYDYAHNDYLQMVSEDGLFVIFVMVWMWIAVFRKGFAKLKSPSRLVRGTALGAMSGIVAITVHSFGDFNLCIPANALLFTVLAAIVAVPVHQNERNRRNSYAPEYPQ